MSAAQLCLGCRRVVTRSTYVEEDPGYCGSCVIARARARETARCELYDALFGGPDGAGRRLDYAWSDLLGMVRRTVREHAERAPAARFLDEMAARGWRRP